MQEVCAINTFCVLSTAQGEIQVWEIFKLQKTEIKGSFLTRNILYETPQTKVNLFYVLGN